MGGQSASEVPWKVRGFFYLPVTDVKNRNIYSLKVLLNSFVKVRGIKKSFVAGVQRACRSAEKVRRYIFSRIGTLMNRQRK